MITRDSYFLLFLYLPALYIFYILMTWATCIPVSEIGPFIHLMSEGKVPEGSTCFLDNHMSSIVFYSYPPLKDSYYSFGLLILGIIGLIIVLMKPTLRLFSTKIVKSLFSHSISRKRGQD